MLIFLFPLVAGIPVFDGYFCHKIRMFDIVDKMEILKREIEGVLKHFDTKVLGKTPLSYGQSLVARIATRHTEAGSNDRAITRAQKKQAPMFWGAVFFTEGSTLFASSSSLRVELCRGGTCLVVPYRQEQGWGWDPGSVRGGLGSP